MSGSKAHLSKAASQSSFLDFSPSAEGNKENAQSSEEGGIVNKNFDPDVGGNLLRVPSQESMASTATYQSNASSLVQVRPVDDQDGAVTADFDEDESWEYGEQLEKSMPSHQFRSIRGLPSENAMKKGVRRTLKSRAQTSRASLRSLSRDSGGDTERVYEDQVLRDTEFTPEEFAELTKRRQSIKEMPTSIRRKRSLRENVATSAIQRGKTKRISAWKQFKFAFAMGWQHFKDGCKEILYSLDLWRGHLKLIHGMFGSGVMSYFVLLRWLFLLNIVILLLTIFFLFIPQIIYGQSSESNNASFTGWELLTGEGWFAATELYYGAYTNQRITEVDDFEYNMPMAYLCVGGGYLLLCLVMLVYSMANSYRENYIYSGDEFSFYASKVFCSWDYGITDRSASLLKHKSAFNELQEAIAEQSYSVTRTLDEKCELFWFRVFTNFIVLALMGGSAYLILFSAGLSLQSSDNVAVLEKLLLPLVVSGINLIMPMAFRIIATLERYKSPRTAINVNLARTTLMMLISVTMVVVLLFVDIQQCRNDGELIGSDKGCDKLIQNCWENYVGYAFYRLVIVDFVFLLLSTFFGEFVRRIVIVNCQCCQALGPPGFDISRNVIDLIYSQCLCWIGTFFCPMLPVIQVIKLFILFYVKRTSVVMNCRASMRPFRASRMNLLFLFLLAVSFFLSMIVIGYTIMSSDVTNPSQLCGPFRGNNFMYEVVTETVDKFPKWLQVTIEYASSASFIALLFCILGIIVYYFKMLKDSNEKKIKLLKEQISLAGRDKLYLIKRIKQGMSMPVDANLQ
ncbi:transmembrane channel-like protein 7 isoform X1 [Pocillopora verrucosa]|uniref:transmembrane channel-like protein 7 isoform X1 n=2 Tax=Pocillopora verrucosa TaxID=203993 RepID=UPI00334219C0